jgi:DNA-binding NarL/FixJ family response regulator
MPGKKMPAENSLGSLGLTPREAEVLTWIAQGKSNYEIGMILTACTGTICKHVEHILAKLNVENRTAAAVVAIAALANAKK